MQSYYAAVCHRVTAALILQTDKREVTGYSILLSGCAIYMCQEVQG